MLRIKFDGPVRVADLEIPGWAGELSENKIQPWQCPTYSEAATTGLDILYEGLELQLERPMPAPFVDMEDYYALIVQARIRTPDRYGLMILPHPAFYANPSSFPLAVAAVIQTDWWNKPLQIVFRYSGPVVFRTGMPIARAVLIPRQELQMSQLTDAELTEMRKSEEWIDANRDKYITRVRELGGKTFDNLYAVLRNLEKRGKLPQQIKKRKRGLRRRLVLGAYETIPHSKAPNGECQDTGNR